MFGQLNFPALIDQNGLLIKTTRNNDTVLYHRKLSDKTVEKMIGSDKSSSIIINPVEPINTPKPICNHLLIEFEMPLVMAPESKITIYLTFPLEIGVFLNDDNDTWMIDLFSMGPQKYTLYGEPTGGTICKYWSSQVYTNPPEVSPFLEGVMELDIVNSANEHVEVTRAVFSGYHMKLFYSGDKVYMKSILTISERGVAETKFEKKPASAEMKKSLEIFRVSKINLSSSAYIMEFGL